MSLCNIKDFLNYDPITGLFTWTREPNPHHGPALCGDVAGHINDSGYVSIRFKNKLYYAHRLAWFFMHREMPIKIDHKNLDKSDNSIKNLRKASQQGNSANRNVRPDSRSGYKGVYAHPNGRFYSYIVVDGIKNNLGAFGTAEEAAYAYDKSAAENFGVFARPNIGG